MLLLILVDQVLSTEMDVAEMIENADTLVCGFESLAIDSKQERLDGY